MARLIDADKAKFFIADVLDTFNVPVGDRMADRLLKTIDVLPAVDAVEVVRCKDCKDAQKEIGLCNWEYFMCKHTETCNSGDHFCSYGERKDNG